jgi:hypothetical protein
MIKQFSLFLLLLITVSIANAQAITEEDIKREIDRIDAFDGEVDGVISLNTLAQTQRGTDVFVNKPLEILQFIEKNNKGITFKTRVYKGLQQILEKAGPSDYYQLTYYEKLMNLTEMLVKGEGKNTELQKLQSESKIAINLAEFIKNQTYARDYWLYTIRFYPTEVLAAFINLYNEPYAVEVVEQVALSAPTVMKDYFNSQHLNMRILKKSEHPHIKILFDTYKHVGSASKSYILFHEIVNGTLNASQAHEIGKDQKQLFKRLLELKKEPELIGQYSIERELEAICMEKVVEINLRHDLSDNVRYEPINESNAYEIYTCMVYTPEEIFTSSFLGMYERMMSKMKEKTGYEFLAAMKFNKFRIFLKQCAGFNKLDHFLNTMTNEQKDELFKRLCSDLDKTGGDLSSAVDLADFYGSLQKVDYKKKLKDIVEKTLIDRASAANLPGMKLYGLLFKLMGGDPAMYVWQFDFVLPELGRISNQELFPDGQHIQQHFFFDDDDGLAAYNNFVSQFGAGWKREDKGTYLLLSTQVGKDKKMLLYCIKPQHEIKAREDLKDVFELNRRYPDLVVHRGHSYYIEHTIANMTNHTKIAILGSCGGYQNISQAMEKSIDVQIVSTKQIGTLAVNNALIFETLETIKSGKDVVWAELWKRVRTRAGGNPRFNDYVPPHLNLGARFIRAYHDLSVRKD